jgi:hypothetical protein
MFGKSDGAAVVVVRLGMAGYLQTEKAIAGIFVLSVRPPTQEQIGPAPTETALPRTALVRRTLNKLVCGNVGAFRPRFQRSPADCADRVTCMRCQELLFSASVLGAAIALNNGRHPRKNVGSPGWLLRASMVSQKQI